MSTGQSSRSLYRQKILEEDEYTAAISSIIARDFFPSLVHLDATNDYLDAVQKDDRVAIDASVRRLQALTPLGGGPSETPVYRRGTDGSAKKDDAINTALGLDAFQAQYTSEDNASFVEILHDENETRKAKYLWAWDAQKRVTAAQEKLLEQRERMLIEGGRPGEGLRETFCIEPAKQLGLITAGDEGDKNSVVNRDTEEEDVVKELVSLEASNQPEPKEVLDVMAPLKDKRKAGVDGWNFKTRNSLYFSPDQDRKPYDLTAVSASSSSTAPRVIVHSSTRVLEQRHDDSDSLRDMEPPSPSRSRIDAAITGTPYRPINQDQFPLVAPLPSPSPAELGQRAVNQLMTTGTLYATPRILSTTGGTPNDHPGIFHLPPPTPREQLSQRLSNKASKSLRAKAALFATPRRLNETSSAVKRKHSEMGPPIGTPRRTEGSLTPAGKRLLNRTATGGNSMKRPENDTGTDLARVRWTPTPSQGDRRARNI